MPRVQKPVAKIDGRRSVRVVGAAQHEALEGLAGAFGARRSCCEPKSERVPHNSFEQIHLRRRQRHLRRRVHGRGQRDEGLEVRGAAVVWRSGGGRHGDNDGRRAGRFRSARERVIHLQRRAFDDA